MIFRFLLIFSILFSSKAFGACFPEFVDYSLEGEIKEAPAVLIATPINKKWVNDEEEPDFYAGAIYQLEIHETIYSKVEGKIELWDPNNSSRFGPDIGKRYLFIMYENTDGKLAVSYCGNSGLLSEKEDLLPKIRELIGEF